MNLRDDFRFLCDSFLETALIVSSGSEDANGFAADGIGEGRCAGPVQQVRHRAPAGLIGRAAGGLDGIAPIGATVNDGLKFAIGEELRVVQPHRDFFVRERAIIHAIDMPFAAVTFHVNEDGDVSALGESSFCQMRVMPMTVKTRRPLDGRSAGVCAAGRINAQAHIDEPLLVLPDIIFPSVAFADSGHAKTAEGVVGPNDSVADALKDIRIGGAAIDCSFQQPRAIRWLEAPEPTPIGHRDIQWSNFRPSDQRASGTGAASFFKARIGEQVRRRRFCANDKIAGDTGPISRSRGSNAIMIERV